MSDPIKRWRVVKPKTPVIGIDDGGFNKYSIEKLKIPVFGVVMKGRAYVDGVIQCQIQRDDSTATHRISQMIIDSVHKRQLQAIFLQGITIGGFGVIDITQLHHQTGIPVVVVLRKVPDYPRIREALDSTFADAEERWTNIKRAGQPIQIQEDPLLLLQVAGIHREDATLLTKKCTAIGTIPEALRIAHFIGVSNFRYFRD